MRSRLVLSLSLLAAVSVTAPAAPAAAAPVIPSDPLFAQQWPLADNGALHAPEAWEVTQGRGTIVAVIDSGVDEGHPDLRGALWTNPGEVPGNGVDDDHDGVVDDVHGVDLVNHDGDPADDEGHGTHVAGLIAARANGAGTVGLAPAAQIMAIKVLDANRQGNTGDLADGIRYAVAHGATVINTSVNGDELDTDLLDAVRTAKAAGVTIVASAGNDGRSLDLKPSYPASFGEDNVITVAATDERSLLASFSNFGLGSVDIAAPGDRVLSTSFTGGYELRSGTSMAAPYVAATLALLHSARPDLPDGELRAALLAGATRMGGLSGLLATGELDATGALRQVLPADSWSARPQPAVRVTARVRKRSHDRRRSLVTWKLSGEAATISRFRVSGPGGRTLSKRSGRARGAWVRQRRGRVRITAFGSAGSQLAAVTVRLK